MYPKYTMLIFDIGANIGRYSVENAKDNVIISVEASLKTYNILKESVKRFSNITPLHYAVTPGNSPFIQFYECSTANTLSTLNKEWLSHPTSRFANFKNAIHEVTVPARTIDSLIKEYGMPDLIKVDVEGAEHIVLQSLTQKVPLLCFEWASEWVEQNKVCIRHLASLGFSKFHIQMGDSYTYRPTSYGYTVDSIVKCMDTFTPKKEWGMIWTC